MGSSAKALTKFYQPETYGFGGKGKTGVNNPGNYTFATPSGMEVYSGIGENPFYKQMIDAGFYEKGFLNPNIIKGQGGTAQESFDQLQNILGLQAAGAQQGLAMQAMFGPQQIELAGKLAKKDYETLSQLPQYKDYFKTQETLQKTAQAGLEGFDQAGFGQVPGAVDTQLGNFYAQGVSRLGLQGSPLGANQAGTAYAATKAQFGEQLRQSRINQALGIQQGFHMPGSLLGNVTQFGNIDQNFAMGLIDQQYAAKAADQGKKLGVQQGYGSLFGAGLGAFSGLAGAGMIANAYSGNQQNGGFLSQAGMSSMFGIGGY